MRLLVAPLAMCEHRRIRNSGEGLAVCPSLLAIRPARMRGGSKSMLIRHKNRMRKHECHSVRRQVKPRRL